MPKPARIPPPATTTLALLLPLAMAATLAGTAAVSVQAQTASPLGPGVAPRTRADPAEANAARALVREDRERLKADQRRLQEARDAHDEAATRTATAAVAADEARLRDDEERWAERTSGESLKR